MMVMHCSVVSLFAEYVDAEVRVQMMMILEAIDDRTILGIAWHCWRHGIHSVVSIHYSRYLHCWVFIPLWWLPRLLPLYCCCDHLIRKYRASHSVLKWPTIGYDDDVDAIHSCTVVPFDHWRILCWVIVTVITVYSLLMGGIPFMFVPFCSDSIIKVAETLRWLLRGNFAYSNFNVSLFVIPVLSDMILLLIIVLPALSVRMIHLISLWRWYLYHCFPVMFLYSYWWCWWC